MRYSESDFGKELKEKLLKNYSLENIGWWVYSVYLDHISEIDSNLRNLLLTLNTMEDGPEFAFSYEELNQIADDLIAGKDVKL